MPSVTKRLLLAASVALAMTGAARADHDPIHDAARAYVLYDGAAAEVARDLPRTDAKVHQVLKRLGRFDPAKLGSGWVASAALAAASAPGYMTGVKRAAAAEGSAARLADRIVADPFSVMQFAGAADGLHAALEDVRRDNQLYVWLAGAFDDLARGKPVREQPLALWVLPRPNPVRVSMSVPSQGGGGSRDMPAWSAGERENPSVVVRLMALGALHILGESAKPERADAVQRLLHHNAMTGCLSWARANLSQCTAAARGRSENTFCTGTHAVDETAKCFSWILPANY